MQKKALARSDAICVVVIPRSSVPMEDTKSVPAVGSKSVLTAPLASSAVLVDGITREARERALQFSVWFAITFGGHLRHNLHSRLDRKDRFCCERIHCRWTERPVHGSGSLPNVHVYNSRMLTLKSFNVLIGRDKAEDMVSHLRPPPSL